MDLAKLNAAGVREKVTVHNKIGHDVRLVFGVVEYKVLDAKKSAVAVLGPVKVRTQVLNILREEVFALSSKGKLLKVKAVANINLGVLASKLMKGVRELVLEVVEVAKRDLLRLRAGNRTLVVAEIKLNLEV